MELPINPLFNVQEVQKMGIIINPYRFGGFVMPSGLVARWEFNGDANDSSGNGYNLTNTDAVLTTDRNGASDKAYEFNGSSAKMTVSPDAFILQAFTICLWYKANAIGGAFLKLHEPAFNGGIGLYLKDNQLSFHYSGYWSKISKSTSDTSNWHFVCASFDKNALSDQVKLQIDNGSVSVATKTTDIGYNYSEFIIGLGYFGYFNGKIDQFLYFNRELTSAEKTSIYNYYL